jgi:hypothetical protein
MYIDNIKETAEPYRRRLSAGVGVGPDSSGESGGYGKMRYPKDIPEEELKNRVGKDFFDRFDYQEIKGKIDFAVKPRNPRQSDPVESEYYLWAEAKAAATDILIMLTQLVLTIGKAKTFDTFTPPNFLGCFDREKFAFVPYHDIMEVFSLNDFNWNVAPSNRETKEFKLVRDKIKEGIKGKHTCVFSFADDEKELIEFIKNNFAAGKEGVAKIQINKNNFKWIYDKWVTDVMPTINVIWPAVKKLGIIDCDFYLADLLSADNKTIREKLSVLLNSDRYRYNKQMDEAGILFREADFVDCQRAHKRFWAKYERPPKEEYWDYIIDRRDLLVPQDIRERKGSFYTPKIWVELSQKYIADVFGEDWQDEYCVWDCAAGTGNLLVGLTNPRNVWASDLFDSNVAAMKAMGGLFENHVFQFDFLNDDFKKLPKELLDIVNDEKKRKKLIIYINPPYAEAANYGKSKDSVSSTKVYLDSKNTISFAVNELFSQFFARIYKELPDCILASFGKLKYVTASNFSKFRDYFRATLLKGFVCRANTFDNVKGNFPISFLIWNLERKKKITKVKCDVFDNDGNIDGKKTFFSVNKGEVINDWLRNYYDKRKAIGYLRFVGPDFQANSGVYITSKPKKSDVKESRVQTITQNNLMEMCVYLAVRQSIPADWLNDRDQFLYPNDGWKKDKAFQNDCLAYTLFHGQNNISSNGGVNHWIPFAEEELGVRNSFDSHFMQSFIGGKIIQNGYSDLFEQKTDKWCVKRKFSREASAVFSAGRELWRYYHRQPGADVNASLYDIREHFQGRNGNGKMNNKSADEEYNKLIGKLRERLKILAQKIEPKVYEYGFLK